MPIENWFAFMLASFAVIAIPGPTILLVIAYSLSQGKRAATAIVAGVGLGDLTAVTGTMLGLGAVLSASAEMFLILKWIGAAYLVFLGVKLWRSPVPELSDDEVADQLAGKMFWHTYAVTALNPKGFVFLVAFLPQFLDLSSPLPLQMAILGATFVVVGVACASSYAYLATSARQKMRRPSLRRAINRAGGTLLIGAGMIAAFWRRSPA